MVLGEKRSGENGEERAWIKRRVYHPYDPVGVSQPPATVSYSLHGINSPKWGLAVKARRKPVLVLTLSGLVVLEAAVVAATAFVLLAGLASAGTSSPVTAIALVVLALLFAAGLLAAAVGLLRSRAWTRAAILVWQVVQFAVGASALTGSGSQPGVGWPLMLVALVVAVLLFTPPVLAATRERGTRS